MTTIISVIGSKKSGKTLTMEYIISKLSTEGFSVGSIKHVHDEGFTIDTKGKDTWRFANAGSKVVLCISPDEISIIRKSSTFHNNINKILDLIKNENVDIILIEGFHGLVAKRNDIYKIITAKDSDDLNTLLEGTNSPIIAITGVIGEKKNNLNSINIPLININTQGEDLINLIKKNIKSN